MEDVRETEPNTLLMGLRDMWTAIKAHRWLAIGSFLGLVGTGMLATFLMPVSYESTVKILVSRERVDPSISPGALNGEMPRPEIGEEEFNTELEIVRSREVIDAVARELSQSPEQTPEQKSLLEKAIQRAKALVKKSEPQSEEAKQKMLAALITANVNVGSIRKSRVITITYRDRDPERAAKVLNLLYEKYADQHLKLHENAQVGDVFKRETDTFNQRLLNVTEELKRFDANSGVISAEPQKDMLLRQLYETQAQANAANTEKHELEKRIEALKNQLSAQPERIETGAVIKYVNALDKMKEELLTMELQRTALIQKYQPNSRPVRELEQRIAQARKAIAAEEANPPQEKSFALNDVYRRLLNDLLAAQASLATVRERVKRLDSLVAEQQAQVIQLDQKSFKRAELERTRAINEEAYLLYHKKAQEADIARALNKERVVNVSLAEAATAADRPVSPKPLINFVVLCVLGFIAGVAGAVLKEKLHPILRHEDDLRRRYKLRVLAKIPNIAS